MKTLYTFFFCLIISFCKAQVPSDSLIKYMSFENLKGYRAGYGESVNNPLNSGAFKNIADRNGMQARMAKLRNTYRWSDGSIIDFSKRGSTMGKSGMVDQYTLENPKTKELLTLIVNPYQTDSTYYIPKGLIAVNKDILAKEIAPHLNMIDEINKSADAFASEKEKMNIVSNFIAMNIGISHFIDRENLIKVITDTQANNDLKSHLFGTYIINKFYALGKNLPEPKAFALTKMKDAFHKFQKLHPDAEIGNIKINLNE